MPEAPIPQPPTPELRELTYKNFMSAEEAEVRALTPHRKDLWDKVDKSRMKLNRLEVKENLFPKANFTRDHKVMPVSSEKLSSWEEVKGVDSSVEKYTDQASREHSVFTHTDDSSGKKTRYEIIGGDLKHPGMYEVIGVDAREIAEDGTIKSDFYYAGLRSKLTTQEFTVNGEKVRISISGLVFMVHEEPSGKYPKGRVALTWRQEQFGTTGHGDGEHGDRAFLRTPGQGSMNSLKNPRHPISIIVKALGGDSFLKDVEDGKYPIKPHQQVDPDRLESQHNVTLTEVTATPEQAREIEENSNGDIFFVDREGMKILAAAGLVNQHTSGAFSEYKARRSVKRKAIEMESSSDIFINPKRTKNDQYSSS